MERMLDQGSLQELASERGIVNLAFTECFMVIFNFNITFIQGRTYSYYSANETEY